MASIRPTRNSPPHEGRADPAGRDRFVVGIGRDHLTAVGARRRHPATIMPRPLLYWRLAADTTMAYDVTIMADLPRSRAISGPVASTVAGPRRSWLGGRACRARASAPSRRGNSSR